MAVGQEILPGKKGRLVGLKKKPKTTTTTTTTKKQNKNYLHGKSDPKPG